MKNVALRNYQGYEYNEVSKQFENLIKYTSGIGKYINKNSKVFIKLNLVIKKDLKEMATTYHMALKVVLKHLLNHGCKVIVVDFTDALVDICSYVNPSLTIMDGIIGMEGEGPTAGVPRKVGVLLASPSPYAIDVVACKIINLNPNKVPTVQRSIERKFIKDDFSDIAIVGEGIEDKIIKDFKIPQNKSISFLRGIIPKSLEVYINKKLAGKPVINYKKCVKCGECSRVCPPKVISTDGGYPDIDLDNCIR